MKWGTKKTAAALLALWRGEPCGMPYEAEDALRCRKCGALYLKTERGWIHGTDTRS